MKTYKQKRKRQRARQRDKYKKTQYGLFHVCAAKTGFASRKYVIQDENSGYYLKHFSPLLLINSINDAEGYDTLQVNRVISALVANNKKSPLKRMWRPVRVDKAKPK